MIAVNHPAMPADDDGSTPVSALNQGASGRSASVEKLPESPSNTTLKLADGSASNSAMPITTDCGVDTVKLTFPVKLDQSGPSPDFWVETKIRTLHTGMDAEWRVGYLKSEHADVRVTLYMYGSTPCHLEFNAARLSHGKSEALLPPDQLIHTVRQLLETVKEHAWPTFIRWTADGEIRWDDDWADQVRIKRLDLARNLVVSDPALVKRVLPSIVCRYARRKAIRYEDTNGGWGLVNPTEASGQDRLYDKGAELAATGSEYSLRQISGALFRFETQLQAERLGTHGMTRLSDVCGETAWRALEARWAASRWGSPLPASSGLLEALEGLSPPRLTRLIGYLHLEAVGEAERILGSGAKGLGALARKQGLTPGMRVEFLGKSEKFLSLQTGALEEISTR